MCRRVLFAFLCGALRLVADQNQCAACHPAEVKAFQRSAMGRSISTVANQPDGRIHHDKSGSIVSITHDGEGSMLQEIQEHGLTAEYKIAYAVGAGKVGFSYLIGLPPFLFQSPVSFYSQAGVWDVTPGYEPERTLDFTHPISEGCVFCHTAKPNLKPATDNQFNQPALAPISCERCHGNSAAHIRKPISGSIVNPGKLAPIARDSVCEQCHLEGEERILNPGKHWDDFAPGAALESIFSTYLNRVPASQGTKAVSHAEQLSLSRCARESAGRLWCGSCHNSHSETTNRIEEIKTVCLSCHGPLFTAQKHPAAPECVTCHMPRLRPSNVAHAAITDHLIGLPNSAGNNAAPQAGAAGLSAWRSPAGMLAERNLALARFKLAIATKDSAQILRVYEALSHLPKQERDPEVLATLASILLQQGYSDVALSLYRQAVAAEPQNARFAFVLGSAYAQLGNQSAAIAELRRSIFIDPSSPDAYRKLVDLYDKAREPAQSRQVIDEYLKFMPQNLEFRRLLSR